MRLASLAIDMSTVMISMSPDGQFRVATAQPDEAMLATGKKFSDVESAMSAAASMLAGTMGGSDMEVAGKMDREPPMPPDPDAAMAEGFSAARGPRRMSDDGMPGMR